VQTVLIIGTSRGIDEAAAKALLADGWKVVATARDPATVLRGVENPRLLRVRLDLTDTLSMRRPFKLRRASSPRSTLSLTGSV
jgi:NAD(P)-dependent dehydrogenase (short-subunit alcohol dehydrogenase family)